MAERNNTAARVDQDLVWRLLRLVNLIAKPFFSEHASRHHLSINDWRVMMALAVRPGATASDVCEQTGMHPMNVSRSVARLERLARVKRFSNPRDRRRSHLRLTAGGHAVFRSIAPSAQAREEVVRRSLSRREAALLRGLLDKLIDRIGAETNSGSVPAARKRRAQRLRVSLR